jgi:hypothetical protein
MRWWKGILVYLGVGQDSGEQLIGGGVGRLQRLLPDTGFAVNAQSELNLCKKEERTTAEI